MHPRRPDGVADAVAAGVALPAFVLGVGLGGFVDGIVLHQLLQWHHLVSSTEAGSMSTVSGLEHNTLADGLFHAGMWLLVVVGIVLLRRRAAAAGLASARALVGWLVAGWGGFNVADEVVFHALLDLHHIREGGDELAYDMAFLALGAVQLLGGWLVARSATDGRAAPTTPTGER